MPIVTTAILDDPDGLYAEPIDDVQDVVIADEPEPFDSYTIICPECLAPIGAESRGKADRAFARHFVTAHRAHLRLA